jgi:anti-sigma regulatory factor (Ser/Thr protein kinase)
MTASDETSSCERRLVLGDDLGELGQLDAFVHDIGRDEGLNTDQIFALGLCLEEAVANIIMYGGPGEHGGKHIAVTVMDGAPSLAVCLEDDGGPFDPTKVPPPSHPMSLEEARIGGMGVHLIRKLSTDMRYERVDGRNRLTLTFGPRADPPA